VLARAEATEDAGNDDDDDGAPAGATPLRRGAP
jgi:hypothetical protein